VAGVPSTLVLKRDRDLEGRAHQICIRRVIFGVLLVVPLLALFNVFGQRPSTSRVTTSGATLKVYAPSSVRGGLIYQARFTITAHNELKEAALVFDPGWLEGITVNTIEPSPLGEGSENGRLRLELGHIPAGQVYRLFMDFQVNPTNIGHRSQTVELDDGDTKLLEVERSVTVYP
jgi:hypothetical protein